MISLLVPSRRPLAQLEGMLASLTMMTAESEQVELIVRFDDDDPDVFARCGLVQALVPAIPTHVIVGQRQPIGVMTVEMAQFAQGQSLWLLNDDVVHETYGWDRLVAAVTAERPGHAFFPDDCMFSPELACFPLLPTAHVKVTDFYGVGRYERYLIDSIISDLYSFTLDRLVFLPQWKVRHLNAQPVSLLDEARWYRTAVGDATRGYQPAEDEMLTRDKVRYLDHLKDVRRMADAITALECVL